MFEGSDYAPTYLDKSPAKKRYVRQLVLEKLAGSAAHDLYNPTRVHDTSDKHDLRVARRFVGDFVSWDDEESYFATARSEVIDLVQQNWHSVELVAQALLEHDILQRDELLSCAPPRSAPNTTPHQLRQLGNVGGDPVLRGGRRTRRATIS